MPKGTSIAEAFKLSDDILRQAVQGISDIITTPGLMNLDFSDIKSIMLGSGYAMMGTAICQRRERGDGGGASRPSTARCSTKPRSAARAGS